MDCRFRTLGVTLPIGSRSKLKNMLRFCHTDVIQKSLLAFQLVAEDNKLRNG